jgi:hypothetical protein
MSAGLGVLAVSGGVAGGSYFWWQGEGTLNPVVASAGVVGLLVAVSVLLVFLRAAWQRTLHPGWWLDIVPVLGLGLFTGSIVAPFAALDVEAGVFMALLIGPIVVVLAVWVAAWTSFMVFRGNRRRVRLSQTSVLSGLS